MVKFLFIDPPTAPTLQVTEVTFNFIRLTWSMLSDQIISGMSNLKFFMDFCLSNSHQCLYHFLDHRIYSTL